MRMLGRLTRGLAALAVLVALLAGVPWALWHYIGWPLPHTIPTWAQISQALTSNGVPEALLFKSLAVVCWLAWAALTVSIAAELPAALRGRVARRLPFAGPLQPLAHQLVVAALLLLQPLPPRPSAPPPPTAIARTLQPATIRLDHPPLPAPAAAAGVASDHHVSPSASATAPTAHEQLPRYVVRPRDTLWSIAAHHLGDPLRWREIFHLNRGRPQPDEDRLTNPDLIRPGWVLLLPADASHPTEPSTGVPGGGHPSVGHPHGQPSPSQVPTPRREPGPSPDEQRHDDSHQARTPAGQSAPHRHCHVIELPSGAVVGLSLALAVSAALAAARLHRRRRWQPEDPRPGISHTDPLTTDTVRRLHQAALAAITPEPSDEDDEADGHTPPAPPTPPAPAVPPIRPRQLGMVTLGHRDGEELTVDLASAGGIALTGPGALSAARALLVAAAASGPEAAEIVVAGSDLADALVPDLPAVPGFAVAPDLDAGMRRLEVALLYRTRLLDDAGTASLAEFAAANPAEPLPLLVLLTEAPLPALVGRLGVLLEAGRRLAITAIVLGEAPGIASVTVGSDGAVQVGEGELLGPLRSLSGARLFTLTLDQARETLAVLAAGHGEPVDEEIASPPGAGSAVSGNGAEPSVSTAETGHAWVAVGAAAPSTATLRPIKVRVLGPIHVEVDGEEVRTGLRGKARELLALLLVYPEGVSSEFAAETLWPGAPPPRGAERLQTVVTNLRGKLRPAADTEATIVVYLQSGRRYQLEPDLIDCDLWRFQAALDADTRARQVDDRAARLAALKQAVAAYGGSFAEHEQFGWAEAPREELRRQANNAASRLAELYQQDGQLDAALAILERAITWDPYAERLYVQAMRLAAALGHRDTVQRLFDQLTDRLSENDAEPDLATKRLLTELLGPSSTRRT